MDSRFRGNDVASVMVIFRSRRCSRWFTLRAANGKGGLTEASAALVSDLHRADLFSVLLDPGRPSQAGGQVEVDIDDGVELAGVGIGHDLEDAPVDEPAQGQDLLP